MTSLRRPMKAGAAKAVFAGALALTLTGIAAGAAEATPAPLSGDQLSGKLALALNRGADHNARVNELADPSTIKGADNIAALKDTFGWMFGWSIKNPQVVGNNLNATLAMTYQGREMDRPLVWNNVDNQWKLSRDSVCAMAQQFQTSC